MFSISFRRKKKHCKMFCVYNSVASSSLSSFYLHLLLKHNFHPQELFCNMFCYLFLGAPGHLCTSLWLQFTTSAAPYLYVHPLSQPFSSILYRLSLVNHQQLIFLGYQREILKNKREFSKSLIFPPKSQQIVLLYVKYFVRDCKC